MFQNAKISSFVGSLLCPTSSVLPLLDPTIYHSFSLDIHPI